MSEVTRILTAIEQGNSQAVDELLPAVYQELRVLAAQKLVRESPGHTLQATALVHEAYLRLVGPGAETYQCRSHFFVAAAEAMQQRIAGSALIVLPSAAHLSNVEQAESFNSALISFLQDH